MESLLQLILDALNAAGIRAQAAYPYKLAPRLKSPMTTLRIARAAAEETAMGRYLGAQELDGYGRVEREGMALRATLSFRVASPASLGGAACFAAANALMDVLLGGISGITIGEFTQSACSYARELEQFECTVQAEIRALLLPEARTEPDEPVLGEVVVREREGV